MDKQLVFDLVFAFSWAFAILMFLVFRVTSMRRMENAIMAEGRPRPCPWDGISFRAILYAAALVKPRWFFNEEDEKPWNLSPTLVKRHSRGLDVVLAWLYLLSLCWAVMFGVIFGMLFGLFGDA